jgi:large repetitive protein
MKIEPNRNRLAIRMIRWLPRPLRAVIISCVLLGMPASLAAQERALALPLPVPGLVYTNYRVTSVPWSIHVVRVDRTNAAFELHSVHAEQRAVGLDTLSSQLAGINRDLGLPVAGINGDFYQRRDRNFMGDPRGLQISDSVLFSASADRTAFWVDTNGQPQLGTVLSKFRAIIPRAAPVAFGLNEPRASAKAVLYTPSMGTTTHTSGGRELILEQAEDSPWLPLRIGTTYTARVKAVRETGNSPLGEDAMVLSFGAGLARTLPALTNGTLIRLITGTSPELTGVSTAISGGPVLIQDGKRQRDFGADQDSFEFSSMQERHPRSALGWNSRFFFLVEVDGRQWGLSDGMTLDELSAFMAKLGCEQAMNLDGGGSATIWFNGRVRNRPCDGHEREIANSLAVIRKSERPAAGLATTPSSSSP